MMRWIFAVMASIALLAAGLVHGYWTDRWVVNEETRTAAERLDAIPLQIGDWTGEEIEVKPGQGAPGVAGCIQRRYINRKLGATVVLALVNGRPGPVATHTPEVCYGASGYQVGARKPVRLETPQIPAQFWTSDATRTSVTEETRIRLYWAWNGGEGWVASADARNEFPRYLYPILHKLYVIRDLNDTSAAAVGREEPCELFLQVLLPELAKVLYSETSSSRST
jgi:hypothetical protein